MSFARPMLLILLAMPVLLGFWQWNRRGLVLALPFDHGEQGAGARLRRFVSACELFAPVLLGVAILLAAGPQQPGLPEEEREMTNIQFLLDASGSMSSRFGEGSRFDNALKAIQAFTEYREGDAFGLSVFGNEVLHWVPLTKDLSAIRMATPFLQPRRLPGWFGGTQIGKAVRAAMDVLVCRQEGDRMIILVSDGMSSDLGNGADIARAMELRAEGIVLHAIHVSNTPPPAQLMNLATLTGGDVFAVDDPAVLDEVFRRIDAMQRVKIVRKESTMEDRFGPFAAVGLVICALQVLASYGARYTPW